MDRRAADSNGLGQTEASKEAGLKDEFYDLDFSVQKSRRYHEKLSGFYGNWRDRIRVVTVIAGSSAFLLVVKDWQRAAEAITAFVALWAVLDIIIRPDKKHELHDELGRKFTALAARLQEAPQTAEALRALTAERLRIEENEPPCKRLVDLEARNDECRARGFPSRMLVPLSTSQRFFGYYGASFGMKRLEAWKADCEHASIPSGGLAATSAHT